MSSSLRDFTHVIRLAVVFVLGVAVFLVWRAWMVPPDFGVHGHYRAGALVDARARPVVYAGQTVCGDCHSDVSAAKQGGAHSGVSCEACHGPLSAHATGTEEAVPQRPDGRGTCLPCHAARAGKPEAFAQVVVADHAGTAGCTDCHQAHSPRVE